MQHSDFRTCPLKDCTIENHVHGHGTDEMYLPKPAEQQAMETKPGSLEALLKKTFEAGVERGRWHGNPKYPFVPPDYEQWRRGMLPDDPEEGGVT